MSYYYYESVYPKESLLEYSANNLLKDCYSIDVPTYWSYMDHVNADFKSECTGWENYGWPKWPVDTENGTKYTFGQCHKSSEDACPLTYYWFSIMPSAKTGITAKISCPPLRFLMDVAQWKDEDLHKIYQHYRRGHFSEKLKFKVKCSIDEHGINQWMYKNKDLSTRLPTEIYKDCFINDHLISVLNKGEQFS